MTRRDFLLPFQQRLIDQVDLALDEVNAGGNSQGILLIGASGTGKSHGLDMLANRYQSAGMDGYQRITPLVRVSSATKADAYTTVASVLRQLGKPLPSTKGSSNLLTLENSMQDALLAHKVRILILEEFHNALLSGTKQLRGQTARLLKNLWNQYPGETARGWAVPDAHRGDYRLVIVISGTDELRGVFDHDPELRSRFSCLVEASKLDFQPPLLFKDFRAVFRGLAERFGLDKQLNAKDFVVTPRFLAACEAHLRDLETLLQRTATLHRRDPRPITLDFLAEVYDSIGGLAHPFGNPFRWSQEYLAAHMVRSASLKKTEAAKEPKPGKKTASPKKAKGSG